MPRSFVSTSLCWWSLVVMAGMTAPLAWAGCEVQTDWSGGGETLGPVAEWGNRFSEAEHVAWRSIPGQLTLSSIPLNTFIPHSVEASYKSNDLQAVDLDGDSDLDLVGAYLEGSGSVIWWRNDGGPAEEWTRVFIDHTFGGARGVYAADFDGDGRKDVAGTGFCNEMAIWWNREGDPITWEKQVVSAQFLGGHRLFAADFDLNGKLDLVGAAAQGNDITIWLNQGGAPVQWVEQVIDADYSGAVDIHAADIDRDGDPDVVGCAYFGDLISWWRNDGGSPIVWQGQTIRDQLDGAHCVRADDIDGDGDLDVAAVAYNARDVIWCRNDGGDPITWTCQAIDTSHVGVCSVRLADLDGDGDVDLVASAQDPGRLSWWENSDGLGTSWTQRDIRPYYSGAWPLDVADMNEDGLLDVVCGAYYAGTIDWWSITQFGTNGWIDSSILDLSESPEAFRLEWDTDLPAGTALSFRLRASDDPANLGDWSDEITQPGIIPGLSGRYAQYRAELSSGDPSVAPIIREIQLDWGPATSTPDPDHESALKIHSLVPSPSVGHQSLILTLPRRSELTIGLYSTLGRRIAEPWRVCLPAGTHHLPLRSLPPGMYFYLVQGEGMSTGGQFVRLR